MKSIAVLGSTGSVGQNTLEVARRLPEKLRIIGLSAYANIELLWRQILEFQPKLVCVGHQDYARRLESRIPPGVRLFVGASGLKQLVSDRSVEEVVMAISGSAALVPLVEAIDSRKDIVLANKEALVMAGPIIMRKVRENAIALKPVDSEQSAIWQCLQNEERSKLKTIYLTASGGPLRGISQRGLKGVSIRHTLKHPCWKMGRKISVDSATLMNKGLEVLEAMYLFGLTPKEIKVLIHPEAIVHSMVEFVDGVILAQISIPDMRIPIQYALTYPERLSCDSLPGVDFLKLGRLVFQKPDFKKFPCLGLAYTAASSGGTAPCVLNAANEVAVEAFLKRKLSFLALPAVIEQVLARHHKKSNPALRDVYTADAWARQEAERVIRNSK
jgi:1-deoxy-D-xylulose-5-phosphate reductoisomerase